MYQASLPTATLPFPIVQSKLLRDRLNVFDRRIEDCLSHATVTDVRKVISLAKRHGGRR
jgi:hypothetical protein